MTHYFQGSKVSFPKTVSTKFALIAILEGIARYAGLLLAPAEGFSIYLRLFWPSWQKNELFMLFVLILGHFWFSVVTSVTFSSNLSNSENNPKNSFFFNPSCPGLLKLRQTLGGGQICPTIKKF